eukprot:756685-Hanusia_phi.AAC.4
MEWGRGDERKAGGRGRRVLCMRLQVNTKLVKQLGLFDKEGVREFMLSAAYREHKSKSIQVKEMEVRRRDRPSRPVTSSQIPESTELVSKHEVEIPGGDMIFYSLPRSREPGNLYSIAWPWHAIFGNLCRLNLQVLPSSSGHQEPPDSHVDQGNMVRALFYEPRPKVFATSSSIRSATAFLILLSTPAPPPHQSLSLRFLSI